MVMPDSYAKQKWKKENLFSICLTFHRKNDADIVAFLDAKGSEKQKYIRDAVREYMTNHPEESEGK